MKDIFKKIKCAADTSKLFLNLQIVLVLALISIYSANASVHGENAGTSHVIPSSISLNQQQKTVKGKIIDNTGDPIVGVTVVVVGTNRGVISDIDGNYSIEAAPADKLTFSFLGMRTQEIIVGNQGIIDITLDEDMHELDEVVVVGYGSIRKKDVTGSVVSVGENTLRATPAANFSQALIGRAAGVDITQGGYAPGSVGTIRIRGNRSITASNEPLYVIDGMPFNGGTLNDINVGDIESIEILKDASATAIYGSRAANGVILITTKRGKEGKTEVSYNGYFGIQKPLNLFPTMNAAEFAELRREALRAVGKYASDVPVLDLDKNMWYNPDPLLTESISMAYDEAGNYNPNNIRSFDWFDLVSRTGITTEHQVSVRGGNDKTKASLSLGYLKEDGVMKTYDQEKYSVRIVVDQKIGKRVSIGGTLSGSIWNNNGVFASRWAECIPLSPPRDEDGNLILKIARDTALDNPIIVQENNKNEAAAKRIFGIFYFEWEILNGLKYRMNFGPDFRNGRTGTFRGTMQKTNSTASLSMNNIFEYAFDNLIYYDKVIDKHRIGVTLLQSIEQYTREALNGNVQDLPYLHQLYYNLGSAETITGIGSSYEKTRRASFMGRVNYSFNDKYILTETGRYDGASMLAEGNKWYFFPSISGAWRIISESFMKELPVFSDMKLRVGYGLTGNSAISAYSTLGGLSKTVYATDDGPLYGFQPSTIVNPELSWERTGQVDIGLDFAFLDNRIRGVADWYRQNTRDLILPKTLPNASGFGSITQNVGRTRNSGVELTLSGDIFRSNRDGFDWSVDLIFTKNKEEIVELAEGKIDDVGSGRFIGKPITTYFAQKYDGIWQDTPGTDGRIQQKRNELCAG